MDRSSTAEDIDNAIDGARMSGESIEDAIEKTRSPAARGGTMDVPAERDDRQYSKSAGGIRKFKRKRRTLWEETADVWGEFLTDTFGSRQKREAPADDGNYRRMDNADIAIV